MFVYKSVVVGISFVVGYNLGYMLSDLGYDVWMCNARGNRYSKNHTSLNSDYMEFWDFTFHEMGKYDLPANIDYILAKTGYDQLHYVGHSQVSLQQINKNSYSYANSPSF